MAKRRNDTLRRGKPTRRYKKVVWISAEGKTEKDYFLMDVFRTLPVSIAFPKKSHSNHTNPTAVLNRLNVELRGHRLCKDDEAWLVVDIDQWEDDEFDELLKWSHADQRHHLAVSNPKFEVFLVMHFERANGCTTSNQVDARIKKHMPNYDKRLTSRQFDISQIRTAVENAQCKREPSNAELPEAGMTDVHKLVIALLGKE